MTYITTGRPHPNPSPEGEGLCEDCVGFLREGRHHSKTSSFNPTLTPHPNPSPKGKGLCEDCVDFFEGRAASPQDLLITESV